MEKILGDIRVLDLTQFWFGPFCTMLLADLGADVIRIEPPWGAVDRIADGALFGGVSYTFHHFNLNKKNLTLNLKSSDGLDIFKELVKKSHVVVQNFRTGTIERLGLGYEVLKALNPAIIYAALSGFGQYGPYSLRGSFATIAEAMSSHTRLTGDEVDPEGPPIEMAQAYGDLGPALFAAMSIIAALRYRDKTGVGQMIEGKPKEIKGQPATVEGQEQDIWTLSESVCFTKGGLYHTKVKPGDLITEGEVVGTVTNFWGEVIETIRAQATGRVGLMIHNPVANPGDTAITLHL